MPNISEISLQDIVYKIKDDEAATEEYVDSQIATLTERLDSQITVLTERLDSLVDGDEVSY